MTQLPVEPLHWITEDQVRAFAAAHDTPAFVYSEERLRKQVEKAWAFPVNDGYGLQLRFAMKANPNRTILSILRESGVHIDAGSEHEVARAMKCGYEATQIQLTSQQLPRDLASIVNLGVHFTACSLHQLEQFGKQCPGRAVGVRFNPGLGSGSCVKTDVGGARSAFGIWYEKLDQVKDLASKYDLKITTIHTHIGSGSDPQVWEEVAVLTLGLAAQFPHCDTVNLGGGYKVARMSDEHSTDMQTIGAPVKEQFAQFFAKHGRKLKLEIEPGSFYTVNMGILIAQVEDVIDTGSQGHDFIKLNVGMDSITRPALYAARHPIIVIPRDAQASQTEEYKEYVVSGHCCESGDSFTRNEDGSLAPRRMKKANIGDLVVIEGAGAYCAAMSCKNYNSFPEIAEYLLQRDGSYRMIRKLQTLEQIMQNEL